MRKRLLIHYLLSSILSLVEEYLQYFQYWNSLHHSYMEYKFDCDSCNSFLYIHMLSLVSVTSLRNYIFCKPLLRNMGYICLLRKVDILKLEWTNKILESKGQSSLRFEVLLLHQSAQVDMIYTLTVPVHLGKCLQGITVRGSEKVPGKT